MSEHVETDTILQILGEVQEIQRIIPAKKASTSHVRPASGGDDPIGQLLALLRSDWILSVVGYFANHRPSLPYARLDDEYKVQDLLYCLAASCFPDLQFENPQQKNIGAVTATRVDFSSTNARLFIETKLASSRHDAKQVEKEISEDIVKYGRQGTFTTVLFFVYCCDYVFPNPREFERGLTGQKTIDGHQFNTYCIVKP